VSTPTIQELSRIEKEFSETDQRYFFVPCPHCGFFQVLKWGSVTLHPKIRSAREINGSNVTLVAGRMAELGAMCAKL
jgi:phage terminase large subunit GpA-like protein